MESSLLPFILTLVLGAVLLFLGMRLFWLFVGIMGFALGFVVGAAITESATSWVTVVAGLGAGVVFSLLAVVLQRPAAMVAGFLAAGGAAAAFLDYWWMTAPSWASWTVLLLFGALGALAVWWTFVPAIIFITSFCGASAIVNALESRLAWGGLVFFGIWLALVIAGLVVQFRSRHKHVQRQSARRAMDLGAV